MQVLLLTTHSDRITEDGTAPPSALGVNQSVPSLPGRPLIIHLTAVNALAQGCCGYTT